MDAKLCDAWTACAWATRTDVVQVPALKPWFDLFPDGPDGKKPDAAFKIRTLSAPELSAVYYRSNEIIDSRIAVEIQYDLAHGGDGKSRILEILVENSDKDHSLIAKNMIAVEHGVIDPAIDRDFVMKLTAKHPSVMIVVGTAILALSELGAVSEGKSPPSGKI